MHSEAASGNSMANSMAVKRVKRVPSAVVLPSSSPYPATNRVAAHALRRLARLFRSTDLREELRQLDDEADADDEPSDVRSKLSKLGIDIVDDELNGLSQLGIPLHTMSARGFLRQLDDAAE